MARHRDITLSVENMSCAGCVERVDKALAALPGVLEVNVNPAAETATVTYPDGAIAPVELLAASAEIGHPATLAEAEWSGIEAGRMPIVWRGSKENFDEYR